MVVEFWRWCVTIEASDRSEFLCHHDSKMPATAPLVSQCHQCAGIAAAPATGGEVAECIQCGVTFLLPQQAFANDQVNERRPELVASPAADNSSTWKLRSLAGAVSLLLNGAIFFLLGLLYFHGRPVEAPFQFSGQLLTDDADEFELVADIEAGGQSPNDDSAASDQIMLPTRFDNHNAAETSVSLKSGRGGGSGRGTGSGTGNGAGMFATSKAADSFAYVVDASGSMRGGRMQRVLWELDRSINALEPHQSFFVVFFSNKPFPMMWPNIERRLVAATDNNRKRILQWASTVSPDGGTEPQGALQQALRLKPDVVFFLTDGVIPDTTERVVRLNRKAPTIVNAICIGGGAESRMMQDIARVGGGELVIVH